MKEKDKEYYRQYGKALRAARKDCGLCIRCGNYPSEKGLSVCTSCKLGSRERANRYYREMSTEKKKEHSDKRKALYDKRRAQGLCVRCGNPAFKGCFCKLHYYERTGVKND